MKKIALCLYFSVISWVTFAQETEYLLFSEVIQCPESGKDEIFSQAQEWLVTIFKNSKYVTQLADKEAGKIITKGSFSYRPPRFSAGGMGGVEGHINFTMNLYFKDGRCKIVLTDFEHKPDDAPSCGILTTAEEPPFKKYRAMVKRAEVLWNDMKEKSEINSQLLITSLKKGLNTIKDQDDW